MMGNIRRMFVACACERTWGMLILHPVRAYLYYHTPAQTHPRTTHFVGLRPRLRYTLEILSRLFYYFRTILLQAT